MRPGFPRGHVWQPSSFHSSIRNILVSCTCDKEIQSWPIAFLVPLVTGLMWPDRAGWDGTRGSNFCTSCSCTWQRWAEWDTKVWEKKRIISLSKRCVDQILLSFRLLDIRSLRLCSHRPRHSQSWPSLFASLPAFQAYCLICDNPKYQRLVGK